MFPKPLVAASLEPIMLSLLAIRPMYGYEIIQEVERLSGGRLQWTANRLYPLLHHLENQGVVEAFWKPSDEGPDRKYYRLKPKGRKALSTSRQAWVDLNELLTRLWDPSVPPSPATT